MTSLRNTDHMLPPPSFLPSFSCLCAAARPAHPANQHPPSKSPQQHRSSRIPFFRLLCSNREGTTPRGRKRREVLASWLAAARVASLAARASGAEQNGANQQSGANLQHARSAQHEAADEAHSNNAFEFTVRSLSTDLLALPLARQFPPLRPLCRAVSASAPFLLLLRILSLTRSLEHVGADRPQFRPAGSGAAVLLARQLGRLGARASFSDGRAVPSRQPTSAHVEAAGGARLGRAETSTYGNHYK